MATENMLALTMDAESCSAWRYSAHDKQWSIIRIKGDDCYVHHNRPQTLEELLREIADSLNDNSLQQSLLHILFDAVVADLLVKAVDILPRHKVPRWQLLDLDYWQERAALHGLGAPDVIDTAWYGKHLLPLLVNTAATKPRLEQRKTQESPPAESWPAEPENPVATEQLRSLQQDNERLSGLVAQYTEQIRALHAELENKALVNPAQRRETLIAFLPVIFKDFWSKITPSAVASLLHTSPQQLPEIPSPYPNPDMATVLAKKKQFQLLPPGEQHGIWQFCTLLDYHHLTMHAEFKPLFDAWLAQHEAS